MNIKIDNKILLQLIHDEMIKVDSQSIFGPEAGLTKAVRHAVVQIISDRIKTMIKDDAELMRTLQLKLSRSLEEELGKLGTRIAVTINRVIGEAMEAEFRDFRD